jgi:glucosylglycerate hydrolase
MMVTASPNRLVLEQQAAEVLRTNDHGGWTKASPNLYPHQWSWDSAFVAIGWAHLDIRRAIQELQSLFAAQWKTGKIPHIVFNPDVPEGSYFPDATRWGCADRCHDVPATIQTSGLLQPPVHAIAVWRIWEIAHRQGAAAVAEARAFLEDAYPRLLAWHRHLLTARDPEESGLVTIYHPWESGCDNSPRWDAAMAAVEVGNDLLPFVRSDLKHVVDASQRPTQQEYERYLWLVELFRRAHYDDATIYAVSPFLVKDILMSGILVAANEELAKIAVVVGAPESDHRLIAEWIRRGRHGLNTCWDVELGLSLDFNVRTGQQVRVKTIAGFAPLIAGFLPPEQQAAQLAAFDSAAFTGHSGLRWPLPPSTSPDDPGFLARSYWRGPNWPFTNWLLWWALVRGNEEGRAAKLKMAALDQLAPGEFPEYVEPFTGESLGSLNQSWTAAVALDWLAQDSR